MANQIQKKQTVEKGGISPLAAAVAGMVVGAGVAVAGAVALRDEKNRKNIKKAMTNVKNQAEDYVKNKKMHAQDKRAEVEKRIGGSKEKIEKAVVETKDSLRHEAKDAMKVTEKSI